MRHVGVLILIVASFCLIYACGPEENFATGTKMSADAGGDPPAVDAGDPPADGGTSSDGGTVSGGLDLGNFVLKTPNGNDFVVEYWRSAASGGGYVSSQKGVFSISIADICDVGSNDYINAGEKAMMLIKGEVPQLYHQDGAGKLVLMTDPASGSSVLPESSFLSERQSGVVAIVPSNWTACRERGYPNAPAE